MRKPKCTSKSQSCGNACIERKDVCRQKLSAEMDKVAAQLAGSLARQRNKSRTDLTFEQLQAKFPTEGKFGIQTSKMESSVDAQGNITRVLTQTAADGSGDTLRFTMLTDTKGNHYSVDDGVIKLITNARKDSHWQEAHFAALRGLAAKAAKATEDVDLNVKIIPANLRQYAVRRPANFAQQNQSYDALNVDWKGRTVLNLVLNRVFPDMNFVQVLPSDLTPAQARGAAQLLPLGKGLITRTENARPDLIEAGFKELEFDAVYGYMYVANVGKNRSIESANLSNLSGTSLDSTRRSASPVPLDTGSLVGRPYTSRSGKAFERETRGNIALDAAEDEFYGRKPTGKSDSYERYNERAKSWSEATFGPPTGKGANGFSAAQTEAHDIAHPATHDLIGLDSAGIRKHFGGVASLVHEEAIVNVIEHLSRGDTIEQAVTSGIRLARVLSRGEGDLSIKSQVRSAEFTEQLAQLAHLAIRHDDYAAIAAHVRASNRISGTVLAPGDRLGRTARGG